MPSSLSNQPNPTPTGKIGIHYLDDIWSHYLAQSENNRSTPSAEIDWGLVNAALNTLGIGLEPTIKYLFSESPTFEKFENWIIQNGQVSPAMVDHFNSLVRNQNTSVSAVKIQEGEGVLNKMDLEKWEKDGYVIIKQAISKADCALARKSIYDFIDAKEKDSKTWYAAHPEKQGIMVQLFSNAILDKNRLSRRIRFAYQQLWNRADLLVSMDRVSFNPPETERYHFPGPNLHWDVSLKRPIPFGLQGLLYLTDVSEEQGAFTLVPGFHKKIDQWLDRLPADVNPREQDLSVFQPKPIAAEAGDFIIWHQALPHGSSPNTAATPRIVQYINYQPIHLAPEVEWI